MRRFRTFIALSLALVVVGGCGSDGGSEPADLALGAGCEIDAQCQSGHCIGAGEKVCSQTCEAGDCPAGFECIAVGGGGGMWCLRPSSGCSSDCDGKVCGDDGCGGSCGACQPGAVCAEGVCACTPQTTLGCVGDEVWWFDSCGVAGALVAPCPRTCVGGQCVDCTPECGERVCGPDPACGASCGTCDAGATCQEGVCVGAPPEDCRTTGCTDFTWCDTTTGRCEPGCGLDAQCGANERCDLGTHACVCEAGHERCQDACVRTANDPEHCGRCDRACPSGEVCQESDCQPAGDCRDAGCPPEYYCDLATGDCRFGCAFDEQCGAHEECDSAAHDCVCVDDFHRCGDACVSDDEVAHCGASCTPCATDPNGDVACREDVCQLTCDPDFELCAERCAACPTAGVTGTACDGASCVATACSAGFGLCMGDCAPCPSDGVQTTTCAGAACVAATCRAGHELCGGVCVTCPTVGVAGTTCDGATCVPSACSDGYRLCDGACAPCPTDAVLTTTCDGALCVPATCVADYRMCDGSCVPCPTENVHATACGATGACEALECVEGYYPCGDRCCAWSIEAPFEYSGGSHGNDPSIAIDAGGAPHVLFADQGQEALRYTRWDGDGFTGPHPLDDTTDVSNSTNDIAIGGGQAHVVYHLGARIVHASTATDAVSFSTPFPLLEDGTVGGGSDVTLAVKADGHPIVCWYDRESMFQHGLYCRERVASGWYDEETVFTADDSSPVWGRKRIAVHGDTVHVAFGSASSGTRYMTRPRYTPPASPAWSEDAAFPALDDADLALDAAGYPHLCGSQHSDKLRYVWQDAAGWHAETVFQGLDERPVCNLALDGQDRPHIVYVEVGLLTYVVRGDGGWARSFVVLDGGPRDPDVAVDAQGRPHIVWYGSSSASLVHATGSSAPQVP